ncbi:MAG: hypothetical protein C4B58_04375 [Deltaproteobacteria bacterium]|nr:MAG: hypothetical protein C4B58_04375 [Deltaproteobacteria bacterium]
MGFEPVAQFLPSTRFKSGNNLVQPYLDKADDSWHFRLYFLLKRRPYATILYYLGADVSKGYADFVILDSRKQPVEKNFQMDDRFPGHCQLYDMLDNFYQNHPDSKIYAAVESTGGYENNWFNLPSHLTKVVA